MTDIASGRKKVYAGIGSRDTPARVCNLIGQIATKLGARGYRLRSGGSRGADMAFELSTPMAQREILLPEEGAFGHSSPLFHVPEVALRIALQCHPAPGKVRGSRSNHLLLGRDVQQVLGIACDDPVQFVICWTPDGADGVDIPTTRRTRGTGQAIRVAALHGVPVYNIARPEIMVRICNGLAIPVPEDIRAMRDGLILQ